MRVVVTGGTGLVGSHLLPLLAAHGHEVHSLVRRPSSPAANVQEHVAPPDAWPPIIAAIRPEAALCALGTTIRTAGSQAAFRAVDHDLVLAFARAARAAGATRFGLVSSVGADPSSRAFYLRVKGETERDVAALGFDRIDIFRPGLLRGDRTEHRPGERLATMLSPIVDRLLVGSLGKYASIPAAAVAAALVAGLDQPGTGTHIHDNRAIGSLAG